MRCLEWIKKDNEETDEELRLLRMLTKIDCPFSALLKESYRKLVAEMIKGAESSSGKPPCPSTPESDQ